MDVPAGVTQKEVLTRFLPLLSVVLALIFLARRIQSFLSLVDEGFNGWGGRGYVDFVPGEVTKTAPSGDETT